MIYNPNINAIHDHELRTAEKAEDLMSFKIFNEFNGICYFDGDRFIANTREHLETGAVGCGNTRVKAILNCIHNFYTQTAEDMKRENKFFADKQKTKKVVTNTIIDRRRYIEKNMG